MFRSQDVQQLPIGIVHRQLRHTVEQRRGGKSLQQTQLQLQGEQARKPQVLGRFVEPTPDTDLAKQTVQISCGRTPFETVMIPLPKQLLR